MADVSITIEDNTLHVRGSGCAPPSLRVLVRQHDQVGDRSSSHKATVAGADHPEYAKGDVDFSEPLQHPGDVDVTVLQGDETVASEVFHLG